MTDYLTATEAAAQVGLTREWVSKQCRSGKMPGVKMGSVWLIRRADFEAWYAARKPRGRPWPAKNGQKPAGKKKTSPRRK